MNSSSTDRHILITGASGGLGLALALEYAEKGTHLTLWGRNAEKLESTAAACRDKGASARCVCQDIRDLPASRELLLNIQAERPVDLLLLAAGVSSGALPDGGLEPVEDLYRVMEVNAASSMALGASLFEPMLKRGRGQVVFISSLAALYPLPASPAYGAAKAALAYYAKAMRMEFKHTPVRVSAVYPGYINTPMSRRLKGPQPQRWSAEKAAAHIRVRLEARADSIVFPFLLALGMRLLHLLPYTLAAFFVKKFSFSIDPDAESPSHASRRPAETDQNTLKRGEARPADPKPAPALTPDASSAGGGTHV